MKALPILLICLVSIPAICFAQEQTKADTAVLEKQDKTIIDNRARNPIEKFDINVMYDIARTRTPEKTEAMLFLSNSLKYGEFGIPAGLFLGGVFSNDKAMRQNAGYVLTSAVVNVGVTYLAKHLFKRRRPFIRNLNFVPVYRAGSTSFPSGHTSTTFATATALSIAYPKWYVIAPSYLWAGSVAYSRMYLGVHFPSDVAGGILVGTATAFGLNPLKK